MSQTVTEQEIIFAAELNNIGEDLDGVRRVQNLYGQMPSNNYKLFLLADRDQLAYLKEQIEIIEGILRPNEDGKNQFVMMINTSEHPDSNPLVYMASEMKDAVIDGFKSTLPVLDDQLEVAFEAKKLELEQAQS